MKLSLGPVLFYWDRRTLLDFYAQMAEQPLDAIYLGETVCSKRRAMSLDNWLGLGRELQQQSGAQILLSGPGADRGGFGAVFAAPAVRQRRVASRGE
jgi:hypothetical protein